ncbi:MAG: ABC transporter ATP-binding protein [Alphaproteobacteria bacterium]
MRRIKPKVADATLALPSGVFQFARQVSYRSQVWLCVGSIVSFFLTLAPLEFQRRIVNEALEERNVEALALLSAGYAMAAVVMGLIKRWLNVYRGIVGERATLHLRQRAHLGSPQGEATTSSSEGTTVAIAVAEVEPVGGFVGIAYSEPLLQVGIMVFTFAYLVYLQPWMALIGFALLSPQFLFVPYMQAAINRRAAARIKIVRRVGTQLIDESGHQLTRLDLRYYGKKVRAIMNLNVQIFRIKFSLNFFMNLLHHLGVVGVLLVGGLLVVGGKTEPGTILAFVSGLGQLKEPWTDLVNYYREATSAQVKYELVANAIVRAEKNAGRAPVAAGGAVRVLADTEIA